MLKALIRSLQFEKYPLRGKAAKAWKAASAQKNSRWRYAIRNPDFLNELRVISRNAIRGRKKCGEQLLAFQLKSGFHFIPHELIHSLWHCRTDHKKEREWLEFWANSIVWLPAVSNKISKHGVMKLYIDLNCPIDVLLPLIQEELRESVALYRDGPSRRWRTEKTDFYLKVYDLTLEQHSFPSIARQLKRPVSTVKSAFLIASQHIFGALPGSKKEVFLKTFDAHKHVKSCPICRRAPTSEEMCQQARAYIGIDYESQHEQLIPDPQSVHPGR